MKDVHISKLPALGLERLSGSYCTIAGPYKRFNGSNKGLFPPLSSTTSFDYSQSVVFLANFEESTVFPTTNPPSTPQATTLAVIAQSSIVRSNEEGCIFRISL